MRPRTPSARQQHDRPPSLALVSMDLPASRPLSAALSRHGVSVTPMAWGAAEIHGTLPAIAAPFALLDFPADADAEQVRFPIAYLSRHTPVVALVGPQAPPRACLAAGACDVLDRATPAALLARRLVEACARAADSAPLREQAAMWAREETFAPAQRLLLSALLRPTRAERRLDLRVTLGAPGRPLSDAALTRLVADLNARLTGHGWLVRLVAGAGYQLAPLPRLGRPAGEGGD